jgi:chemotaxis protein CheX
MKALGRTGANREIHSHAVSVIIQIVGAAEGQVVISLDKDTAKKLIGLMFGGMEIQEIDEMGWSAIQEFGNWFVSGIATEFANRDMVVNITHPLVNEGRSIMRSDNSYSVVPIWSACGMIDIYYSISEIE